MRASFTRYALLASFLGLCSTQSTCPAPVTVTVTVGASSQFPATTTTSSSAAPSVTDTPVSGYSLEWSQQTAAANCAGYITSNVADTWNVQNCADQCTANSQCAFFNVYQQQVGSAFNYVCVLWSQDQPFATCGTNSYNNGYPISSSGGYLKVVTSVSSTSATIVTPSSVATIASTTTSLVTPTVIDTPVSGYVLEWSQQSAAANCAGYITSNVADTWNVQNCADQCTANSQCAFFNVYQQQVGSAFNYVCVLWSQDQPFATCGTNSYNNGYPISSSGGYLKVVTSVSSTSATIVTPSSVATVASTTTSLVTPTVIDTPVSGYVLEWSQQSAAANCAGNITSNVADTWNVQNCADQCTANSQCAFFNVYQQQVGSAFNYVCVLWSQDQPFATCGTNSYNNGYPISSSGGYLKNVIASTSTTSSSSSSAVPSNTSSSSIATSTSKSSSTVTTSSTTTSSSRSSSMSSSSFSSTAVVTSSSSSSKTTTSIVPTTLSTRTTTTTAALTTTSASICPAGTPVPTQCSGQNQFVVWTIVNGITRYLTYDPTVSGSLTTLTSRSSAMVYYWDPIVSRLRNCPCTGIPYYRYASSDPVGTDGFLFTLTSGVVNNARLQVIDATTKGPMSFALFDVGVNVGITSFPTSISDGQGACIDLYISMVTV